MALNQVPYTNVHELNLDWILAKLKEYEQRLEAIEDYGEEIAELQSQVSSLISQVTNLKNYIDNSISTLNAQYSASITALNIRCTNLEDSDDEIRESIRNLYHAYDEEIANIRAQVDAINSAVQNLRVYVDARDRIVLSDSKHYTDVKFAQILEYIAPINTVYVINPWTQERETIQDFIDYLYEFLHFAGLTAQEFDDLGLTAQEFDNLELTALEFDSYGKWALFFKAGYVTRSELNEILSDYATQQDIADMATRSELEHYATLNDIRVIDPTTGILGDVQTALVNLASLHQNGLTASVFDAMELDCDTLDGLEFTAYEFDFLGVIFFTSEGYVVQLTGLTAEQWNDLAIGAGNQIFYIGT